MQLDDEHADVVISKTEVADGDVAADEPSISVVVEATPVTVFPMFTVNVPLRDGFNVKFPFIVTVLVANVYVLFVVRAGENVRLKSG